MQGSHSLNYTDESGFEAEAAVFAFALDHASDSRHSSVSDDDAVDMSLEEDLLLEIRMLVKKEKYLEQLEDQLRKDEDDSAQGRRLLCEDLYDDEDETPCEKSRAKRISHQINEPQEETRKVITTKSLPTGRITELLSKAREHYRACFVDVNPIQHRDIRDLVLVSQELQIHQLRLLSKNLFLFSALQSVNLSNNQLDDSSSKEIRSEHST
ncbi:hypothetical protein V7S43_005177 [Phytophthora oleae]|uniref:Uncharacterized protein n=1 Tax=Phytophthora oleae TaxID=2107226 RepID=A0ABD3FSE6_9STRA